jgi:cytochrome c-type biogenesis protein CcmH
MTPAHFLAVLSLAGALLIGAPALPAAAQAQHEAPPPDSGPHTPHPEALKAIDRVKSPFCPGFMLEVCPSPYAAALRDTLDIMARDGIKADSLVDWALARYGDTLSALPPARGRDLIAWIVPAAAVILGIGTVVVVLRRLRRPTEGPPPGQVSDEERQRLDAALRELEAEEETQF